MPDTLEPAVAWAKKMADVLGRRIDEIMGDPVAKAPKSGGGGGTGSGDGTPSDAPAPASGGAAPTNGAAPAANGTSAAKGAPTGGAPAQGSPTGNQLLQATVRRPRPKQLKRHLATSSRSLPSWSRPTPN